jgi:hypothetical protein
MNDLCGVAVLVAYVKVTYPFSIGEHKGIFSYDWTPIIIANI